MRESKESVSSVGLSELYSPDEGDPEVDIVFVHGFQGNPLHTWTSTNHEEKKTGRRNNAPHISPAKNRMARLIPKVFHDAEASAILENKTQNFPGTSIVPALCWPLDLLPDNCPRARILTWGYNSQVTRGYYASDKSNIFAHSRDLLYELVRHRPIQRHLVFVAHSLGGILVKEALRRADLSDEEDVHDIAVSTRAVVFLGTPHRGSPGMAALGDVVRRTSAAILRVDSNSSLLRALGIDSPELELCQETFLNQWRKYEYHVKTFQESLPLTGINVSLMNEKVVPDLSSSFGDSRDRPETLPGNHMEMSKFSGPKDPGYKKVSKELVAILDQITSQQHDTSTHDYEEHSLDSHLNPVTTNPRKDMHDKSDVVQGGTCQTFTASGNAVSGTFAGQNTTITTGNIYNYGGSFGPVDDEKACLQSFAACFPAIEACVKGYDIPEALTNTCDWFFQLDEFKDWCNGAPHRPTEDPSNFLSVHGKPGSGKSTLIKEVLRRSEEQTWRSSIIIVSYFFAARRRSPEGSTLLGFLHALFHQILQQDEDIMSEFLPLFRSKRDRYGPAFDWQTEELVNFITTFLLVHPSNRPILLFVDGLDECQDRDRNDLITFLCSLATPNMQVRICISARHYPLLPLPKCPHVVVEDYNSTAIALFVNLKLSLTGFKFQKRELVNAIVTKANGAFYWTSLMVEKLNKEEEEGKSFEELFHTIESVPAELDGMFSTLFQDLTAREKQESLTLIRWVLLPKDPLTLTELRYAVAFSSDCWSLEISLPTWRGSRHFMDNDRFVRWIHTHSRGLIEVVADFQTKYLSDMFVRYGSNGASKLDINAVERENFPGHWSAVEDKYYTNQRVQFVHESARQFFLEGNGLKILSPSSTIDNIGQAHSCMAEACLRMFGISELEPLDNGVTPLPKEEQYYPFGSSEKATAYYDDRVKETNSWCQDPNGLKKWLLKQSLPFLDYATSNFTLHSKLANQEDGISETLHSALVGYRRNRFRRWTLLQDDYLVSDDTTPLYWACENQLTSYVDALLDQGVDPNQKGGKNCYPLLIAAKTSKEPGLIMKLLKHGADINVTTTSGDTALHLAVIADHALLIPVLCEQGIRIEVRDDNGKTPLLDCALFSEDVDVYRALLAQGANPDAKDYKDNTIVHWSTQAIDDAKLWCQFFINLRPQYLEARNTDQKTPLHLAAMSDQGAVEALLEAGAGPGVRDTHNKTPLHYAAELKDCESMKRLLEAGASIDAMDDAGKTPLHLSVGGDEQKQRILQATRFLVEAGADVTLLDHEGHTAEEVATITGNADTAAFLDSGSWPADMQCYNERYNEHQAIQLPQESDSDEDETHKQRKYVIVPGHGMEDFRRMAADLGFKIENGKFVRQNDSEGS